MLKSIKKSFKYFAMATGIVFLVPTILFLLIRIPEVQTFLVRRITSHFSNEINSTISVGSIDYAFFNKLTINDLLIKDKHNDTLIYSNKVTSGIRKLDFGNKIFRLGRVELKEPFIALSTDTTGLMNLKWYLELLKNSSDRTKKRRAKFYVNQIDIDNARFSLVNKRTSVSKMKVNFKDLHLTGISGKINDLRILKDTTLFNIFNLGFTESNGFTVQNLGSEVAFTGKRMTFSSMFFNCKKSVINAETVSLIPYSDSSFNNFNSEVRLNVLLNRSFVNSSDLHYFLPFLENTDESVWISGHISGPLSELKGRNIKLSYQENSFVDCDFDFSGLPKIEDAFIYIGINDLRTNAKDFENISIPGKEMIAIPEFLYKLGNITFNGNFTGFTTDFVTYGKIITEAGNLQTDISLRPEEKNRYSIKGLVSGMNIDLGKLTGNSQMFGKISMETDIDVRASSVSKFSGDLKGKIDSIEINKYIYRNILMNGIISEKMWDGAIKVIDENVKMDLLGLFDFRHDLPEFDFTLNLSDANLYRLNFDKTDTSSLLSLLITANFKGNNIDNLNGEIKLLNSNLRKYNENLDLYNFSVRAFTENSKPAISVRTDFADADLRGYYSFMEIGTLFRSILASLMPSKFPMPEDIKAVTDNRFSFNMNFSKSDEINNFFKTGISISDKSTITGEIFPDSIIMIEAKSDAFSYKTITINDLFVAATIKDNKMDAGLNSTSLILPGQAELRNFKATFYTKPDNFEFYINWDNKEKILNTGDFKARGSYTILVPGKSPVLNVAIDPSEIYTRDNLWKISGSEISVDSNSIFINKLFINNNENYYLVNGTVSENPKDTLFLEFRGIDLTPLNFARKRNKGHNEKSLPLNLKGILSGKIQLADVYKNLMIETNIAVNNFSILGGNYGEVSVESAWNSSRKVAEIKAGSYMQGLKLLDISGFYDPATKKTDLTANALKMPVEALNPLLKIFASDIHGTVSGKVNLGGEPGKPVLTGALKTENTSLRVDYLMTRYKLNDTIRFDKNKIIFNNTILNDEKGNFASISGSVSHTYFKDFKVDLTINTRKCLVLNTQPKDNELFYGTVYATGVTTIQSKPDVLSFEISARTDNNTRFFIPLNNTGLSISDYSFVSFVDPNSATSIEERKQHSITMHPAKSVIELNMDLDVTPEAEVQLLIDPKAGDVVKGRGSGKLNLNLDREGDFKISGTYSIDEGEYLFTLGNILNKRFDVERGGKIVFNGNMENAEIEMKATYKNLKASLYEILQDERYNERIPVEPQLNLSGQLFSPIVGFNIHLPNADEGTRAYLRNAITSEEELSRQFLYLIVMNSFYSDPTYRSSLSTTSTGTSAMAVTTTEMLSNQLSNWLSQISNDFDIGFVYRPGYKDVNSQELQVALSTQLLNDKVTINGNFDVRGADNSYGNPITGDFDIEYKIAEKIRFKVFNRFNNPYTGKGVPYTQGIGLFYKQDFNKFTDLLKSKSQSEMKKEDDVIIE